MMLKKLLLLFILLIPSCYANPINLPYASAELTATVTQSDGKSAFWILFQLKLQPNWHTYWQNPGDTGLPPKLSFEFPEGFQHGPIVYQSPQRIPVGPLMNYGYEDNAYYLVEITPPAGYQHDEIPIKLHAEWIVCKTECLPEQAQLNLTIPVGATQLSPESDFIYTLLSRTQLPQIKGTIKLSEKPQLEIMKSQIPYANQLQSMYFYPLQSGTIKPAAQQIVHQQDTTITLSLTPGKIPLSQIKQGLLELSTQQQKQFFEVNIDIENPSMMSNLWLLLLFAIMGGFILNAMPCVFPVLSIKIIHLLKVSKQQRKHLLPFGLSYTLGVLVSFALIGGTLIVLRTTGAQIGWGYQMQSPLFIACLVYLLYLVGLNLSGYFDILFTVDIGNQAASREDWVGNFFSGALVTLVATPCTAPFMATALGSALTQPNAIAMLIFMAVGFGLALPFLLITMIPNAFEYLPKPGPWMVRLKEFLAFPIFISVIWLVWVFMQQMNIDATAILLLSLVLITFCLWVYRQTSVSGFKKIILISVLSALCLSPLLLFTDNHYQTTTIDHSRFSQDRLNQLRAQNKPVFVYVTAAWCITCKVNEKVALNSRRVQEGFKAHEVTLLKADWTNRDAVITQYLNHFHRSGVPLYVLYPGPGQKPIVLPELLTPEIVLSYLRQHLNNNNKN